MFAGLLRALGFDACLLGADISAANVHTVTRVRLLAAPVTATRVAELRRAVADDPAELADAGAFPGQLLGEEGIAFWRMVKRLEQQQPAAQEAARQLARTRLDIDVAADAVQVERQGIDEGVPDVLEEALRVPAERLLMPQELLFQVPALLIHLAVYVGL